MLGKLIPELGGPAGMEFDRGALSSWDQIWWTVIPLTPPQSCAIPSCYSRLQRRMWAACEAILNGGGGETNQRPNQRRLHSYTNGCSHLAFCAWHYHNLDKWQHSYSNPARAAAQTCPSCNTETVLQYCSGFSSWQIHQSSLKYPITMSEVRWPYKLNSLYS